MPLAPSEAALGALVTCLAGGATVPLLPASASGGEIEAGDLVIGPMPPAGTGFRAAVGNDIVGPAVVARWDVCPRGSGPFDEVTTVVEIAAAPTGPALRTVPAPVVHP